MVVRTVRGEPVQAIAGEGALEAVPVPLRRGAGLHLAVLAPVLDRRAAAALASDLLRPQVFAFLLLEPREYLAPFLHVYVASLVDVAAGAVEVADADPPILSGHGDPVFL